jgi:hypothetical protein
MVYLKYCVGWFPKICLKKVVVLEFFLSTAILESVSLAIAMNWKSRCDAEYCNVCAL